MRYANAPPVVLRILPGLQLLVVEFVAPEHLSPRRSIVPGSRDEGNTTYTLRERRVVFSRSLSVFSSINIWIFTQTPASFALDETRGWAW